MLKQIRVSTGEYTIQRKERRKPDMQIVLVWRYKDTNLIMWRCSYIYIFVQKGERVWDMNAFSFCEFIVCHNEETGRVFCV